MVGAISSGASAQSQSIQQSGAVTAGHVPVWIYNGILGDAGTSANPTITTFGVYGTGTPSCVSNTKIRTGGWYNLCLGYASDLSAAQISLNSFGGAASIPLNLVVNGATYSIGSANWLSTLIDSQFCSTQGSILYRNSTVWTCLGPASSGFLATNGSGANPSWSPGTGLTAITANSVLANTTNSTAVPVASAMAGCGSASLPVSYTNNSGFICAPYPTRQVLTAGATYTPTNANVRQLRIRMVGGGSGGGGGGVSGGTSTGGGDTVFNSIHATGASSTPASTTPGAGGTGGAGTASFRSPGAVGGTGFGTGASFSATGATGASSLLGGAAFGSAAANTGAGGLGGGTNAVSSGATGAGGSAGEYVELIINNPASTYTYTIGSGGSGGTAGTSGTAGGNGGSGVIIVDEYY